MRLPITLMIILAGLGAGVIRPARAAAAEPGKHLETIKVADNIYLFKPRIDWTHGNGVAIIGPDGVFFIDTYIQFNYAEEAIRLLRRITPLPVRFVLNTHWHNDHVLGNGVFKRAFPGARFIAQDSTYFYMEQIIGKAVADEAKNITSSIVQLQQEIKDGKRTNGTPLVGSMKPFWELQLREAQEYQREFRPSPFVNADITFGDTLTLHWGSLTLRLIHMAENGHAEGDVVVWIPEKRLLVAGDLVVAPTPYATHWNTPGLLKGLEAIRAMNPAIIIPGHGVVEYDQTYLDLLIRAFGEYLRAAETSLAANVPYAQARDSIRFPEIDRQFTGDDDMKQWAYNAFFRANLIYHVYKPSVKP